MRIRKRAVPLPLSLLSPVPFSDLHLVQQQNHPQPSDHPPIRLYSPLRSAKLKPCEDEQEEVQESSLTSRQSDSSALVDNGRWCDGDKAIPLKKRKSSFEMTGIVVTGGSKNKMKSKTNKKCPLVTTSEEDANEDDDCEDDDDSDSKNKKRKGAMKKKKKNNNKKKKGGSIMEGSRCSRVNGRGWRCMQPTLVGYSLCEHHLGKGRLRSMSTVRARSSSAKSCSDDDEKIPKRMRIGMVKARSLSSLLCQPNTAVVHQIK